MLHLKSSSSRSSNSENEDKKKAKRSTKLARCGVSIKIIKKKRNKIKRRTRMN